MLPILLSGFLFVLLLTVALFLVSAWNPFLKEEDE